MKPYVLSNKINNILNDNKFDRFVSGKTRGKLDFRKLSKIAFSPKVFKKKEARQNKDYKVIIIGDASGSMYGARLRACGKSLELISEALEMTDVEYAVWSFSGDILCLKDFQDKKLEKDAVFNLYEKHFDERNLFTCNQCHTAFGSFEDSIATCPSCSRPYTDYYTRTISRAYNADGLALHLAMERLEKEGGKHIIVMLSDGQADSIPDSDLHYLDSKGPKYGDFPLEKVISKLSKTDTVLCSIGIQCDYVLDIYPKETTLVIHELSELGDALVKIISKQIKRG